MEGPPVLLIIGGVIFGLIMLVRGHEEEMRDTNGLGYAEWDRRREACKKQREEEEREQRAREQEKEAEAQFFKDYGHYFFDDLTNRYDTPAYAWRNDPEQINEYLETHYVDLVAQTDEIIQAYRVRDPLKFEIFATIYPTLHARTDEVFFYQLLPLAQAMHRRRKKEGPAKPKETRIEWMTRRAQLKMDEIDTYEEVLNAYSTRLDKAGITGDEKEIRMSQFTEHLTSKNQPTGFELESPQGTYFG